MIPALSRRARIDRFIVSLNPMFRVIQVKMKTLNLGEPRLQIGPTLMHKISAGLREEAIRRGAVWYLKNNGVDVQCGFHVDFGTSGLRIEAWSGKDRRAAVWIAGEYSETTLSRDLGLALVAAGLTDTSRSAVRDIMNGNR